MSYKVVGLRELTRTIAEAEGELQTFMTAGLLEIGENVAKDVRAVYGGYSEPGAAGVQTKIRKAGNVLVAQTLRKSRGLRRRPNFGPLMMRVAFLPALAKNEPTTQRAVDELFVTIRREWDRG